MSQILILPLLLQVIDRLGLATLPMWNISLIVHDVHKNYHAPDSGGECVEVHCDCSHACRYASNFCPCRSA